MKIVGPYITKLVTVPEHVVEVLDEDAYWHLDWEGNEDADGTLLYAKVAFPKLSDAQRQQAMEKVARDAERATHRAWPRRKRQCHERHRSHRSHQG